MKTYKITANNIEKLFTKDIEAENIDQAKEIYIEKFNNGDIVAMNSDIEFIEIK